MKYSKLEKPKISIIVPVYNVEKYLKRCIESIVNQTLKEIEIILIDDGSTDRSKDICDDFLNIDNRVKVFHLENSGVSKARNYGIDKANGKYIMFCDSDDYVDEQWCEYLYNCIEKYPNSWISSGMYKKDVHNNYENLIVYNHNQDISTISKEKYYEIMMLGISGFIMTKIFDRSKINKNRLRFQENLSYGEDVIFTCRYLDISDNIVIINKPLYYYIVYGKDTLSSKYYPNKFTLIKNIYSVRKKFIGKEYEECFYNEYLYYFLCALNDTFDDRNKNSELNKIKYNHKAINSTEFIECFKNAKNINESKLYINLLKIKNYYLIYLINKILKIKNYVCKRVRR